MTKRKSAKQWSTIHYTQNEPHKTGGEPGAPEG
jgi:hypothetical protein